MLSVKIQVIVACLVLIALCVIVNMIRKKKTGIKICSCMASGRSRDIGIGLFS